MNHAEGVQLLREVLARSSPRAAAALREHELDKAHRHGRRTRLADPDRWEQADAAAAAAIENAALAQEIRTLARRVELDERARADAEARQQAESLARARARARRERAERDRPS